MEIDLSSFLQFAENMGAAEAKVKAALLPVGQQVGQKGAQIAQSILQANDSVVTGNLLRDIRSLGAHWEGDTIVIMYGPSSKYPATWVESGRGPVRAREGGYLKFQIKRRGPFIFAKEVGPAAPRPFMRPSVARLQPVAVKMFGDAVMRVVSSVI